MLPSNYMIKRSLIVYLGKDLRISNDVYYNTATAVSIYGLFWLLIVPLAWNYMLTLF